MDRRQFAIAFVVSLNLLILPLTIAACDLAGPSDVILPAVFSAQGSLLAIWGAFAGRPHPWRFVISTIDSALAILALALLDLPPVPTSMVDGLWLFLFAQMMITSVLLFVLRFLGISVTRRWTPVAPCYVWRPQFSLRSLLEWTAAVAIVLTVLRLRPETFRVLISGPEFHVIWIVLGFNILIAMAAAWLVLGARARLSLRLLPLAATAFGMGLFFSSRSGDLPLLLFSPIEAFWVAATLLPFHRIGCRLLWRGRVCL